MIIKRRLLPVIETFLIHTVIDHDFDYCLSLNIVSSQCDYDLMSG